MILSALHKKTLNIAPDAVHVWPISFDGVRIFLKDLKKLLSEEEARRAGGFHFRKDEENYTLSRGCLRYLLGLYLNKAPDQLRFCYNRYGKPSLAVLNGKDIQFNVSHTKELVLYAMTSGREVGVDLEWIQPAFNYAELAKRFFSPLEYEQLQSVPISDRPEAFFTNWVFKEAYVKARGEGLAFPLNQFDILPASGRDRRFVHLRADPQETFRWSLQKLHPATGYVAAVAAAGFPLRLERRRWQCSLPG